MLERFGRRVAAMHETLHPARSDDRDISGDLERCRSEIGALTARLAAVEARQKRRDEKPA